MESSQSLILQRTAGLMQYVEENYGEDAIVRMSLVAIEVSDPNGEREPDVLMAWGDDRWYVKSGFINEIGEELDEQRARANNERQRELLEDEDDDD